MSEKKTNLRNAYTDNLGAVLICLIVAGNFIDVAIEGSHMARSLFLFIYSFHMPFLIFLTGAMWGETARDREKTLRRTGYLIFLYFLMKLIVSITRSALGSAFSFSLVKDTRTPWYFWVIAVYGVLAYYLRKVDRTAVLVCSLLLALICGYNESVGDFLSVSRLIVFFPFFCMGHLCGLEKIEKWSSQRSIKIISLCVLAAALFFALGFTDKLYFLRPLLTGRSSYKQLKDLYRLGPLLRMAVYMIALAISAAVMALTPRRRLVYISRIGEKFPQIYFWYRPVLYIFTGLGINKAFISVLGWRWGYIAWLISSLLCIVVLSVEAVGRPIESIAYAVCRIFSILEQRKVNVLFISLKKWNFKIKNKRSYFLWYTILFAAMFVICFRPFYENGKSLIWKNDGLQQHYTALVYIARWIRTIITERKIPMVDFTIGYGADVITSLALHNLFSPLSWIAAFFSNQQIEMVYNILTVLRYYLAGITVSLYCFYMKRNYLSTLTGAFTYIFCGFSLFAGVRHANFLFPVILLPIMLICIEKLIEGKSKWVFSICIAVAGIINYYFCYMLIVVGVVYGFFRGIALKKTAGEFVKLLWEAVLYGSLGIGMAMVVLLPIAHGFASSTRSDIPVYYANNALLYPAEYYERLLLDFASPLSGGAGYWVYISVGAPAAVAIVLFLFTRHKELKWLKQVFLVLMLLLCIPFAGSVMNGFNYVTNRWIWAVCFFAAYILVCETDRMLDAPGYLVGSLIAVLGLTFLIYCIFSKKLVTEHIISFAGMLLVTLIIAFFMSHKSQKRIFEISVLAVSLCGIVLSANYKFDTDRKNYVSEFRQAGKALDITMSNAETSVAGIGDKTFYRISNNTLDTAVNHGMAAGFNSLGTYWSVMDDNIYQYLISAEIPGMTMPHRIYGLDQRCALESLASVKYYAMQEGSQGIVPSGYVKAKTAENPYSGKNDIIYLNYNYLPIGYTYRDTVCTQDYEILNPVQKEQLMLRRLVLDDGAPLTETEFLGEQIAYEVTGSKNITWDKEKETIKISKAKAALEVSYLVPEGDTIYVRLKGFDTNGSANTAATFTAVTNGLTKKFYSRNDQNTWPIDRENYTLNFGVSDGTEQIVTITFPYKALYKLEDLEIYAVPEYRYSEYIENLREESLENVIVDTNLIQGDITVSSPRYLCFSVPYSKGWKAYVDGEKVETMKANIMYMAIMLEPGYHQVRLEYCTPGLKSGLAISIACLGILIGMAVWERRKMCVI